MEKADEGAFWREVILLAVGRLIYLVGDVEKPLFLVERLCPKTADDADPAWRKVWLAGEVLLEMGLNRVRDLDPEGELMDRVRDRLVELLRRGRLGPVERVAAGNVLAGSGTPGSGRMPGPPGRADPGVRGSGGRAVSHGERQDERSGC